MKFIRYYSSMLQPCNYPGMQILSKVSVVKFFLVEKCSGDTETLAR